MRALRLAALLLLSASCTKPIELEWTAATEAGSRCSPALLGEIIVFGNEGGYVNAIDRSGRTRWSFTAHRDVVGTPVAYQDLVLFGSTSNLFYGVNASTGRETWRFATRNRLKGDPTIWGDLVIFGSHDKHLYALRAQTGKLVWQFPGAPVAPADAGTTVQPIPIKAPSAPAEKAEPGEFSNARPLVVEGVVYAGNLDGHLYAVDAATGQPRWRFKTGAGIASGAVHDQGTLYFGSNDHHVYALDLATRLPRWKFQTGDEVGATPGLKDGVLFVGGVDGKLYALEAGSGRPKWSFQTKGNLMGAPAFYENLLFVGSGPGDGALYALDVESGRQFWTFATDSKIETDVEADGNHVYVVVGDGRLLSFVVNKTR